MFLEHSQGGAQRRWALCPLPCPDRLGSCGGQVVSRLAGRQDGPWPSPQDPRSYSLFHCRDSGTHQVRAELLLVSVCQGLGSPASCPHLCPRAPSHFLTAIAVGVVCLSLAQFLVDCASAQYMAPASQAYCLPRQQCQPREGLVRLAHGPHPSLGLLVVPLDMAEELCSSPEHPGTPDLGSSCILERSGWAHYHVGRQGTARTVHLLQLPRGHRSGPCLQVLPWTR